MNSDLIQHGASLSPDQVVNVMDAIFKANIRKADEGLRGSPICIWGTHGIGKTSLVQAYARRQNPPWKFAYCAPAQFEEMGDLHGLPTRIDPDENVIGDEYTAFLPPDWVPRDEGPGILLLDDINRADDRILRGLMQLVQNFEMFSWALPPRWQIVATANPEGGDYSVTPMDDAMLTRMMHVTMVFDVKVWARWAVDAGVDSRGIDFVLTYPETVTGVRTTPRTLCQLFDAIKDIPNLQAEFDLVHVLARSCLDDETVATFMSFVTNSLGQLISPEEILDAKDYNELSRRLNDLAGGAGGARRLDRLGAICTRLFLHMTSPAYEPGKRHKDNFVNFLLEKVIPNDLKFSLHKDLVASGNKTLVKMMTDKRLAKMVLMGM